MALVGSLALQVLPDLSKFKSTLTAGVSEAAVATKAEGEAIGGATGNGIVNRLKSTLSGKGKAIAGMLSAGLIVDFGKKSIDAFKDVGGEVLKLQRVAGGSAESMSRLRVAATESGVSSDTLGRSIQLFSRNLMKAGADGKHTAEMTKLLGTEFKDAHGHILPMDQLLPRVAEKFHNMPNGAEKTALAMKLFGKSGTAMIPMLNKGAEGMGELMAESDKLGLTLSGSSLDSLKNATKSQRTFNAAIEGVKVTIGQYLMPVVTALVIKFQTTLVPIFQKVTAFVKQFHGQVALAAAIIVPLIAVIKAWSIASKLLFIVLNANPIGLVIAAIVALVAGFIYAYKHSETFRAIVQMAWKGIKDAAAQAWGVIKAIVAALVSAWNAVGHTMTVVQGVVRVALTAIGHAWDVMVAAIRSAYERTLHAVLTALTVAVGAVRKAWDTAVNAIKSAWEHTLHAVLLAVSAAVNAVRSAWTAAVNAVRSAWDAAIGAIRSAWEHILRAVLLAVSAAAGALGAAWRAVVSALSAAWNAAVNAIRSVWYGVFRPVLDAIHQALTWLWQSVFVPVFQGIRSTVSTVVGAIRSFLETEWRGIVRIVQAVVQPLVAFFSTIWSGILGGARAVWGAIYGVVITPLKNAFDWIKGIFGGVAGWFSGLWNGIVSAAASILGGVGTAVSGALGGLGSIFKQPINALIGAANWVIDRLNSISFSLPSWIPGVGGKTFGINIGHIPNLAHGGVFDPTPGGTLVRIAEAGQQEVASPVPLLRQVISDELARAGSGRGGFHVEHLYMPAGVTAGQVAGELDRRWQFASAAPRMVGEMSR